MLLKLIDQKIRKAFSDSATQYEVLTGLQHEIGRDLIKRVQQREDCRRILDVGMGTGRMTNRLSFFFPEAKVVGIDFAPGMVAAAQAKYSGFGMLLADALHLPFLEDAFDIVVSNLVYQWADDLPKAFSEAHRVTKPGGTFSFTMFGHRTLQELFDSLQTVPSGNGGASLRRLPSREDVAATLAGSGFSGVKTDYELIKINFDDMFALLRWLKDIGANRPGQNVFVGREFLRRAGEYYRRKYHNRWGIYATFEVIWAEAYK